MKCLIKVHWLFDLGVFLCTGLQIDIQSKPCVKGDLVHEKGSMEDILNFASRADIVVTCCDLNPSSVRTTTSPNLA